ncbi:uncharacterized protein LOC108106139 [Drosophila eugracilis]|uniref:uncharacterized protein LOC108106139 n=1 Tax=Drosophila eugracilis TaxID=29029 RepID=UPI0007E86354|nr:uncharacterized protein LOC108106139 [Drosophila eugracilis]
MPHKRKSRVNMNQRNSANRRLQSAHQSSAPPNVHVKPCNGREGEMSAPGSPKAKSGGQTYRRENPVHKFSEPQYNTTVRKQNEVHIISAIKLDTNFHPDDLAAMAPKVTQKMNFPPDQTVFKNLVPLNVNDSVLLPNKIKADVSKEKPVKETDPTKAKSEPQLADYAEKVEPVEMDIPEPQLRFDCTQEPFDFMGAYRKIYY